MTESLTSNMVRTSTRICGSEGKHQLLGAIARAAGENKGCHYENDSQQQVNRYGRITRIPETIGLQPHRK
jgi:hypothetical protein